MTQRSISIQGILQFLDNEGLSAGEGNLDSQGFFVPDGLTRIYDQDTLEVFGMGQNLIEALEDFIARRGMSYDETLKIVAPERT